MPSTVVYQLQFNALTERIRLLYSWSASLHNQDVAALHRTELVGSTKEHH